MSEGFAPHRLQRRADTFRWVLLVAFAVLAGAFFRTQILQYDQYRLRSESNRLRAIPLAAPRGPLLDRSGLVLADNVPGFTVKLLASSEDSLRAVLGRMAELVALDSTAVEVVVRRFRGARYQPALVFNSSSFDVIARLEEHRPSLPGLVIQTEPRRFYPAGRAVAHVVGYVGEVSEGDLEADRFPGARLGTIVGKESLEVQYDSLLRGRDGMRYIEVNARGGMVREGDPSLSLIPVPGRPVTTTVDLPLQIYIDSLWTDSLAQWRGALVAMTPTGEILAMYSWPSFDPNDFVGGISREKYRQLTDDESGLPLFNRAIKGAYPPASPFKLATAAMALRRGLVTFSTHMEQPCTGGFRFGTRVFRCWKREGHGSLDLTGAIATSCDVYFYQLGLRLGLNALLEDGVAFGFRERTGVDLGNEAQSFYPPSRSYYDRVYGPRGWTNAVTLNLSIGQGENNQTLINVMRFYQALAGDGTSQTPYLVAPRPGASTHDLGLTAAQLAGLRDAMIAVVTRGTAGASGGRELNVAGKTGTAQNSHGDDHGWFIGFAPADRPEIIVGAIMEQALHGSSVAPWVVRVIRRYLEGAGAPADAPIQLIVPADSAPRAEELTADTLGTRP
ncbi:MAG TPA: penicillin-binding protein 2 [Gemmatimonadales bacterium]|nr:penicillin-binding protein 2 [Gemmatimonadales bacterium]